MYYLRGWKQLIDRVVVFTGSKRDFEQYLADSLPENETTIPFMELIQHYNARLRPNESGVGEAALQKNLYVDNCIVGADDYGSVMPHVLSNFVNIVTLNYQIGVLYVQNPPRRVLESLQSALDGDIEYKGSSYVELTRTVLKTIYQRLLYNYIKLKTENAKCAFSVFCIVISVFYLNVHVIVNGGNSCSDYPYSVNSSNGWW